MTGYPDFTGEETKLAPACPPPHTQAFCFCSVHYRTVFCPPVCLQSQEAVGPAFSWDPWTSRSPSMDPGGRLLPHPHWTTLAKMKALGLVYKKGIS